MRRDMFIGTLSLPVLALTAWCTSPAFGEDMPLPMVRPLTKGQICDTPEQVQVQLSQYALGDTSNSEGCGKLQVMQPVNTLVTPVAWYETPAGRALIASFVFPPSMTHPEGWTQYGWIAYEADPDFVPASVRTFDGNDA